MKVSYFGGLKRSEKPKCPLIDALHCFHFCLLFHGEVWILTDVNSRVSAQDDASFWRPAIPLFIRSELSEQDETANCDFSAENRFNRQEAPQ